MFHNCLQSVKGADIPVCLVYDDQTEQENIDYYLKIFPKGMLLKAHNTKDTGRGKLLAAIKYCSTKYMAFLQDDDYYYSGRIELIKKVCEQDDFALLVTPVVFCANGIPTGSLGIQDNANLYLTPPSKWIVNVALAKTITDSPDVPVGWDHAFAHALCSKGKLMFAEMFPIVYNFSNYNATANLNKEKDAEYLKQVKDYEDTIKYEPTYFKMVLK